MATHTVTGAFGFSGQYIARRLLEAGETVSTPTNSPNRPNPFGGKVKARPFRFDDVSAMAESLAGTDVLYNTYWVRFNQAGLFQPCGSGAQHRSPVRGSKAGKGAPCGAREHHQPG